MRDILDINLYAVVIDNIDVHDKSITRCLGRGILIKHRLSKCSNSTWRPFSKKASNYHKHVRRLQIPSNILACGVHASCCNLNTVTTSIAQVVLRIMSHSVDHVVYVISNHFPKLLWLSDAHMRHQTRSSLVQIMSLRRLETYFSGIWIKIRWFSLTKMHLKVLYAK